MFFSRLQIKTRQKILCFKNSTCAIVPNRVLLIEQLPLNRNVKCRTFKTSTAQLTEQQSTKGTNSIFKVPSGDTFVGSSVTEQTAQLYLDNVFPLKFGSFDIRQLFFRDSKNFLESKAHQAIPSDTLPYDFAIKKIIGRTKDGGAIVSFSFRSKDASKLDAAKEIVQKVNDYLIHNGTVAPFNLQKVRAFLVKGSPFLEDILSRYPTQRIRIEFQGPPVNTEKLYGRLRQYGKIFDISMYPNPLETKDPARYAIVQFTRVRSATSARTCLHGHHIDETRLNILYEKNLRTNVLKDWLVNHPRITIPVFAAIFAGITYAVFDPVRVFFITSKVNQRFNPEEYKIYRWLKKETWARFTAVSNRNLGKSESSVWADDPEKTGKLISWLAENPETFVIVTGHKGSGKSALVKSAISDKKYKIFIDCEDIGNARNRTEMTKSLAKQVGYFPIFTWATSLSSLVDTLIAATTGQKAGLSTTPDSQIKNILETVAIALRDIVLNERLAQEKLNEDEDDSIVDKIKKFVTGEINKVTIEDEKSVDSKVEEKTKEKVVPIVVLDNFMYRETAKNSKLWEELAEWASLMIENEVAHVVVVSANPSASKTLGKALPNKSFSVITLSDAPPEKSLAYINKQLGSNVDDPNLLSVVSALGGRLTELELLVQKMKMNMDADSALEDIITRNIIEIRKYGFGDASDDNKPEWSSTQFWAIVKLLSKDLSINYDELKWGPIFGGNDLPLKAMERSELITITQKEGHANSIHPGKPIYYTVFHRLVMDSVFAASMEVESNTTLKKQSEEEITKIENQIDRLMHTYLPNKPPRETEARIKYLLNKVVSVQKAIEQYDANIKAAKETISKEWVEKSH